MIYGFTLMSCIFACNNSKQFEEHFPIWLQREMQSAGSAQYYAISVSKCATGRFSGFTESKFVNEAPAIYCSA